jgi:hypothetical protein
MLGEDAKLIHENAKSGSWSPLFSKGVSDFCKDTYLIELAIKNKVKPESALEFKNKMKMVIFHIICDGANSGKNNSCAKKFAKNNPDLIEQILRNNDGFFITEDIKAECIMEDHKVFAKVLGDLKSHHDESRVIHEDS